MFTRICFLTLRRRLFSHQLNSFIQGSDPQFGMFTKDKDFVQETANFEFFIANVNRLKPLFAVVCGDLTNANSPSEVAEYNRIAKRDRSENQAVQRGRKSRCRERSHPRKPGPLSQELRPRLVQFHGTGDLRNRAGFSIIVKSPSQR